MACSVAGMIELQPPAGEPAPGTSSAAQILEKTVQDGLALARAELTLAKREALEQARAWAGSALLAVLGVLFLEAALVTLGVLLVLLLHASALGFVVVAVLFAIALGFGLVARRALQQLKGPSAPARAELDAREVVAAIK